MFTVDVEEYFQVEAYAGSIARKDWNRYPFRGDEPTKRLLDHLDAFRVRGTFFVLGWLAERNPALVEKIRDAGHEVASHGYGHGMISGMTPEEFRQDIRMSKRILEGITRQEVRGYRAPTFSIMERTSWAYKILLDEGFRYSSSVFPIWHDRYGWPGFGDEPRKMADNGDGEIWEIPMAVGSVGRLKIPFGGGGYLRAYPLPLTKALFRRRETEGKPVILYVHPWELDTEQPPVRAPLMRRLRHKLGIANTEKKVVGLLRSLAFGTVAEYLVEIAAADKSGRSEEGEGQTG